MFGLDLDGITGRLKALLPARWFADEGSNPIRDAVLAGIAWGASYVFSLLGYVALQMRLQTSTDIWLDTGAQDYFGPNLPRLVNELDPAYSARIQANLLAPKNTRAAVGAALLALTGHEPIIFEPKNTGDTGGYGHAGMTAGTGLGYGVAGGYGSPVLPFQVFITAFRKTGGGIAGVGGYYPGSGWAGGGYGVGALEYANDSMLVGEVTDAQVYATIAATMPAATIAWVGITTPGVLLGAPLGEFILGVNTLG